MFCSLTDKGRMEHMKEMKLERIGAIINQMYIGRRGKGYYDCLMEEDRIKYGVEEGVGGSENPYHVAALQMIERYSNGLVLDVGAGLRNVYYGNVVNLDIVGYATTDVVAVGESLPFKDGVFDAVHSNAVLEHVKDPWTCAREIVRVLKPGGEIMCCVPFLQPFHSCPHHYYNMTCEGLKNLFQGIKVSTVEVYDALRPMTTLQLIINDWASELRGRTKERFLNMKLQDFLYSYRWMDDPIVTELPEERHFKLACGHTLFGRKDGSLGYELKITRAVYGARDVWKNVLPQIVNNEKLLTDNTLTISVHRRIDELFGDPCPGVAKELVIDWNKVNGCNIIAQGTIKAAEFAGKLRTPIIL